MIPRQHLVRFYGDDVVLTEAVASFIKLGLPVKDTLIVMGTASHRADLRKVLTPEEFANPHLMFVDPTSLLSKMMVGDWPRVLRSRIQKACQNVRVRLFGEMVAGLWAEGKYRAAIELWNTLQTTHPFSLLHAYPPSAVTPKQDPQSLPAVRQVHGQKTGTSPRPNGSVVAAVVSLPASLYSSNPRLLLCFARVPPRKAVPNVSLCPPMDTVAKPLLKGDPHAI